jgi:hypothetical protein
MATPLENWFIYLSAIHDRARDLSNFADESLRAFEEQKPSEVLPRTAQQNNLSDFLRRRFNQSVPTAAYDLKSFAEFVDFLVSEREAILQAEYRRIASKHEPDLFTLSISKFLALPAKEAFPKPASREELFVFLDDCSPGSFFSTEEANRERFEKLLTSETSVREAVKKTYKQAARTA